MKIYHLSFMWCIPIISGLLFQFLFVSPSKVCQQEPNKNKPGVTNIVFKSADGGQTWKDISEGLPENLENGGFFANENGLWLRAGNGIYQSKPNSTSPFWTKESFPNKHSSIAPGKKGIYAFNYEGQFLQKQNGKSEWLPVYTNFHGKEVRIVCETSGGAVFIGSDQGLFRSRDAGKTWKQVNNGGWAMKMVELNGVLLATSQGGIIRSTDDGENWALVISEGGVGIDVERIEGGFAAITYSTVSKTRRIRTSYNGGKTWQAIDAGLQAQGFIDPILPPVNANLPAQGFSDSTWHPNDNTILPLPTYITTIVQVGENFFCGHTDGIYRSSDKGKTWKLLLPSVKGKMFKLSVSGNTIYAIQMESHC